MSFPLGRFLGQDMTQVRLRAFELTATRFLEALGSATITFNLRHNFLIAQYLVQVAVTLITERSLKVDFSGPFFNLA
jgi:hypothetical protein